LNVAVSKAVWSDVTVAAVAVNEAVVVPSGMVSDAGTVSAPFPLVIETIEPPAGALFDRVTIQVAAALGARVSGVQVRELILELTVRDRVAV
jgi:hypothetical protein